ncbi:hypothetical protein LB521_27560 [Mesorhizobium sp. BR-1-1-8]|uniref:hypothetical protein n=1 Tax=Mesorhizobium sp. BR-1-1-8 TaxID=2876659 RepID=UPI001CD038B3|nr:hypothetical protein [Mesorhizobium sp. BR-1-1-8]MBZ9984894.1 hypothetical protein [Mesorhizobium sp. BR-1-1-8]
MTPTAFTRWLAEMQTSGKAKSDAECGRLLGVTARQVLNMKRTGATQQTALACAALLDGKKPYGDDDE